MTTQGHHLYEFKELDTQMLHTMFQGNGQSSSGEENFLRCLPYMAWWPSWSYNLDLIYKLSFPICLEAKYEIIL